MHNHLLDLGCGIATLILSVLMGAGMPHHKWWYLFPIGIALSGVSGLFRLFEPSGFWANTSLLASLAFVLSALASELLRRREDRNATIVGAGRD